MKGEQMEMLNIYKIWVDKFDYDTYDSAIVVAKDEESARHIHPGSTPENPVKGFNTKTRRFDKPWYESDYFILSSDWTKPENVNVTLVGTTDLFSEGTVLCASFNAG